MEYFFPSFDSNETSIKLLVVQFDRSLGIFFFLSDRNFLRKLGEKRKHTLRFHARGIRSMNYECVSRVCDPRQLHFCGESNRIPASRNEFDSLPRYLYLDRDRRPLRILGGIRGIAYLKNIRFESARKFNYKSIPWLKLKNGRA